MIEQQNRHAHSERIQESEVRQAYRETSRRTFLKVGFTGAALLGGTLCLGFGLSSSQQVVTLDKQNTNPFFAMSWRGEDFAWLADSRRLAYANDRELFVVDSQNGQQIQFQQTWPHANRPTVQAVSWSADGKYVASLAQTALLVQEVQTGQVLWSHEDEHLSALTACLAPDGTLLALAQFPAASSSAPPAANVQIWHVREKRLILQYDQPVSNTNLANISSIIWSPDGKYLASTRQDGTVQLRRIADGHLLWMYSGQTASGPREALSWSPDGSSLAFSASGTQGQTLLGIWDVLTGRTTLQMPAIVSSPTHADRQSKQIAWSPDGTRFVFETQDRAGSQLVVASVRNTQPLLACQRVRGQPTDLTWSPDGKYLAAGIILADASELAAGDNGDRSVIQFWDAHDGHALFSYSAPKSPARLRWSPDSRYLALITPRLYDILPEKTCLSLCRYGYRDYALEIFQIS